MDRQEAVDKLLGQLKERLMHPEDDWRESVYDLWPPHVWIANISRDLLDGLERAEHRLSWPIYRFTLDDAAYRTIRALVQLELDGK